MTRALLTLRTIADRDTACRWARQAPVGTRLEFKAPRRSLPQNDRLWWLLTSVSRQVVWHGNKMSPEDWKDIFMGALRKAKLVPGIDGGFVPIGMRTSDLSKEEMSELFALIEAFAAQHGVHFDDDGRWDDAPQASDADAAPQAV